MVQESAFRGMIGFLTQIGVYDVILPFLLVFTIVFAILEKTKVLGIDKLEGGRELTKKNINSIVAFSIAFLVIASTQLVSIISEVMANVVLLIILAVCFLMLVGVFFGDKEFTLKDYPGWMKFFMILMFVGIVAIFLNALNWLQYLVGIFLYMDEGWGASIIFVIIIVVFMLFITWTPKSSGDKK